MLAGPTVACGRATPDEPWRFTGAGAREVVSASCDSVNSSANPGMYQPTPHELVKTARTREPCRFSGAGAGAEVVGAPSASCDLVHPREHN